MDLPPPPQIGRIDGLTATFGSNRWTYSYKLVEKMDLPPQLYRQAAIETIEKQKEDIRNRENLRETISDLRKLQGTFADGLQQNLMAQVRNGRQT